MTRARQHGSRTLLLAVWCAAGLDFLAPVEAFQVDVRRTFGGPGADVGNAVRPTPDGGYAVLGYTDGPVGGQRDAWLLRLDDRLDTLWTRRYGGPRQDHGWDLAPMPDGGFVLVGFQESSRGDEDVWIARVDRRGDEIWERTYGGPANERAWALTPVENGHFLVLAETQSYGAGAEDVFVLRIDERGDTVWTRHAGGPGSDRAFSMTRSGDGAIFVGVSDSGEAASRILVGRVTLDGRVGLKRLAGDLGREIGHGVTSLPRGGFLVTGYGSRGPSLPSDVILVWLDDAGQEVARDVVGGAEDERAMMSWAANDGTLATVGYAQHGRDWNVTLQLRSPGSGDRMIWEDAGPGDARGIMVVPAHGAGWILTGTIATHGNPGQLFVMRYGAAGGGRANPPVRASRGEPLSPDR